MQSACPCTLFSKYQRQKMWPEFCRIDLLLNKYNVSWSTRWDGCPGYAKLNWFSIKYAPASSGRAYKWGSWSHFWLNKRKKSVSTCTQRWTWTVSTCTQHWTWTGHGQSSPTLWTFLTRPGLNMTRQSTGEGRGLELQSSSQFVIISKYLQILERDWAGVGGH